MADSRRSWTADQLKAVVDYLVTRWFSKLNTQSFWKTAYVFVLLLLLSSAHVRNSNAAENVNKATFTVFTFTGT